MLNFLLAELDSFELYNFALLALSYSSDRGNGLIKHFLIGVAEITIDSVRLMLHVNVVFGERLSTSTVAAVYS